MTDQPARIGRSLPARPSALKSHENGDAANCDQRDQECEKALAGTRAHEGDNDSTSSKLKAQSSNSQVPRAKSWPGERPPGPGRRKAPQGRRTAPKPGGRPRARGGRDSVLECGSPVPLSRWSGPQSRPRVSRSSRARPKKSAAGRRISKTGRTFERPWPTRQRFGVRESCPAFAMDRPSVETGGVSIVQGPMVATRRAAIGVLWAWSLEFCASFAL